MEQLKINLCSGNVRVKGYTNVDICSGVDVRLDLEVALLPFPDNSADVITCNGAICYFTQNRAQEIIGDVYRVLKVGGVTRFGTQDLELLARKYIEKDFDFYFQKLSNGEDRFPGKTFCEKLNEWFYGHFCGSKHCKYVYDFETLELHFIDTGFKNIVKRNFCKSAIKEVKEIDNRPEQCFFLEAIK